MMKPTVHNNGTSQEELEGQLLQALRAMIAADNALCAAFPNGRDYYPQGEQAIREATEEWRARLDKIRSVTQEVEHLLDYVVEQRR